MPKAGKKFSRSSPLPVPLQQQPQQASIAEFFHKMEHKAQKPGTPPPRPAPQQLQPGDDESSPGMQSLGRITPQKVPAKTPSPQKERLDKREVAPPAAEDKSEKKETVPNPREVQGTAEGVPEGSPRGGMILRRPQGRR